MGKEEKPLIAIKGLTVGYGTHIILHDVDLDIAQRDFIGIIGPNGGGKTTLLKALLGDCTTKQDTAGQNGPRA